MNSIVYHTSKEFSKTIQHSYTPIVIWVIHFTFSFINRANIANAPSVWNFTCLQYNIK